MEWLNWLVLQNNLIYSSLSFSSRVKALTGYYGNRKQNFGGKTLQVFSILLWSWESWLSLTGWNGEMQSFLYWPTCLSKNLKHKYTRCLNRLLSLNQHSTQQLWVECVAFPPKLCLASFGCVWSVMHSAKAWVSSQSNTRELSILLGCPP